MANIREISGRIRSIRDTMKITNAMYMISSTKMRKAKKTQEGNSPYFAQLRDMYELIIASTPDLVNPYLDLRPSKKGPARVKAVIVVTADKGLAGAYNHNVLKAAENLINDDETGRLYVVGEVGRQYFASKKVHMDGQFKYTAQNPTLHRARVIGEMITDQFCRGEIDEAYIVYTGMKNAMTSEVNCDVILPLMRNKTADSQNDQTVQKDQNGYIKPPVTVNFNPSAGEVLNHIVPDMVVGTIYSALVEAFCSEQNDRMIAMDAANKNAQAMIHDLSIQYNRVRQAMITQEITEVIAGAKAQKKKKAKKEAVKT